MKSITALLIVLGIIFNPAKASTSTSTIPYFMMSASRTFNVEVALMYAICAQESKCRANAINKNDGTASQKASGKRIHSLGLFQLHLATARALGYKGTYKKLREPEVNAYYAAKLLRSLFDQYGDMPKVISAYNAGHPTHRNVNYVHRVVKNYLRFKSNGRL